MTCPCCDSKQTVKNGRTHYGKQRFKCQVCNRQFVLNPRHQPVSQFTRDLIDKLLLERISLAGISRVTGVSERWLQSYVNQKHNSVPRQVNVKKKEAS